MHSREIYELKIRKKKSYLKRDKKEKRKMRSIKIQKNLELELELR